MWFWITKPYSIIHPCSRYLWFLIRIWIYIYITYIIFTYLYTRTKQMHMFEFRVFNIRGEVSRWSWTCISHSLKIGMLSWGNRIFQFKHEGSSKSCWTNWVCSHSIPNAAGFSGCLYLVHWTEILIIEEIDPRERKQAPVEESTPAGCVFIRGFCIHYLVLLSEPSECAFSVLIGVFSIRNHCSWGPCCRLCRHRVRHHLDRIR